MSGDELRRKIVDFYRTYEFSNLITIDSTGTPKARMMENLEIRANPNACVFLYRPKDHSSVSIQGVATIVTELGLRKEKWRENWSKYWPDGPTNEDFTLIKVVPKSIIYLDWPNRKYEVLEL
jgi:general stress protein 26